MDERPTKRELEVIENKLELLNRNEIYSVIDN
jgi:hypothetical protein